MTPAHDAAGAARHAVEPHAPALFETALGWVVLGINTATVLVLAWGVLYGVVRFVHIESCRLRSKARPEDMAALRRQVGFYLLFALELLIAADVIETMLSPTLEHLAILGGVALLRIVIGYALGRELHELKKEGEYG